MTDHEQNMLKLATEIKEFLEREDLWSDVRIYFNGMAFDSTTGVMLNINPIDYFEYANPSTVSMSFEGPLYVAMQDGRAVYRAIVEIFAKYGYYIEFGNSWNVSAYPI